MDLLPIKENPNFYIDGESVKFLKHISEKVCSAFWQNSAARDNCLFYKTGALLQIKNKHGEIASQSFFNNTGEPILTVNDGISVTNVTNRLGQHEPTTTDRNADGASLRLHQITPTDKGLWVKTIHKETYNEKENGHDEMEFNTYEELTDGYRKRVAEQAAKQKSAQIEKMWWDRAKDAYRHNDNGANGLNGLKKLTDAEVTFQNV
ncbi:MAG: hypothetical protein LBQ05_01765 [Christensenellaceae bacterium]|nr:hypothetical protein [Christensenellaceae bacterium]